MADQSSWSGHQLGWIRPTEATRLLARWVPAGVAAGAWLRVAATSAHPDTDELVADLRGRGVDAGPAAGRGQLQVLDPERFYTGYERMLADAEDDGKTLHSFGAAALATDVLGPAGFDRFERLLDRVCAGGRSAAMCCFEPAAKSPGTSGDDDPVTASDLAAVLASHRDGCAAPLLHGVCPSPGLLRLSGEADAANAELLGAIVAAAIDHADHGLVIDASDLIYVSIGAWRAVATAVAPLLGRGGRVRLTGLTGVHERVLALTGYGRALGRPDPATAPERTGASDLDPVPGRGEAADGTGVTGPGSDVDSHDGEAAGQ